MQIRQELGKTSVGRGRFRVRLPFVFVGAQGLEKYIISRLPIAIFLSSSFKPRYVDDPAFEVMLFAYAYNDDPVDVVDFACGESLPSKVLRLLLSREPCPRFRGFEASRAWKL